MKTYLQTKLNLAARRMIAAGLAVSVTSFGMIASVLAQEAAAPPPAPGEQSAPPPPVAPPLPGAQQPVPPTPPDRATQATSVRGTVSQYMMNPDGLVDGILLSDGTIVRFAPHMSQQLVQTVKPQDSVSVDAARGEIDGAVLDNGTIVHFPPPVGTQYANLFQVGAPLAAVGNGTINTYGRSLEATSIGPSADHLQTVTATEDRPRGGPEERPRPITGSAG